MKGLAPVGQQPKFSWKLKLGKGDVNDHMSPLRLGLGWYVVSAAYMEGRGRIHQTNQAISSISET